jgi:uncharacterized protein YdhG (YjbR/CyaY superfamily)
MPSKDKPEQTVDRYIGALPPDVAFIMERVRETIRSVAPDATESVKYTMPLFQYDGAYLYVGAWKKHIGLYPVHTGDAALEAELAPYRSKKDTVQFKYAKPVPYDLIAKIARARIGAG